MNIDGQEAVTGVRVYYAFTAEIDEPGRRDRVWFALDHSLVLPMVQTFILDKKVKLTHKNTTGAPYYPYYPFANYDAWQAARNLIIAPGVASIIFSGKCFCVVTTRRYRRGRMRLLDLMTSIAEAIYGEDKVVFVKDQHFLASDSCRRCSNLL